MLGSRVVTVGDFVQVVVGRGESGRKKTGGGRRGQIKEGLSSASRRRLVARCNQLAERERPLLLTLTLPGRVDVGDEEVYARARTVLRMLGRGARGYVWRREWQRRGAVHWHVVAWGLDRSKVRRAREAWWRMWGCQPYHYRRGLWCQRARSRKAWRTYIVKEVGKSHQSKAPEGAWVGRAWGVVGRERLAWRRFKGVLVNRGAALYLMAELRRVVAQRTGYMGRIQQTCTPGVREAIWGLANRARVSSPIEIV